MADDFIARAKAAFMGDTPPDNEHDLLVEPWAIFECDGSEAGPWQIQMVEDVFGDEFDPPEDWKSPFTCDQDAWAFIVERARAGSVYHANALIWVCVNNPLEREAIENCLGSISDILGE